MTLHRHCHCPAAVRRAHCSPPSPAAPARLVKQALDFPRALDGSVPRRERSALDRLLADGVLAKSQPLSEQQFRAAALMLVRPCGAPCTARSAVDRFLALSSVLRSFKYVDRAAASTAAAISAEGFAIRNASSGAGSLPSPLALACYNDDDPRVLRALLAARAVCWWPMRPENAVAAKYSKSPPTAGGVAATQVSSCNTTLYYTLIYSTILTIPYYTILLAVFAAQISPCAMGRVWLGGVWLGRVWLGKVWLGGVWLGEVLLGRARRTLV